MELTKNFQKIGTGTQKQYGGSTGQLELWAKYNSQDVLNNKSNVTVELRLVCSSYIGNYQATYWSIGGDLSTGGNLGSGNYYSRTLGSATGDISHNVDGTKTVNFTGNFNPTAWGYSIDVSESATLPTLHKPPEIYTATMTETNLNMINLGIPDTTVVRYLSEKTIVLDAIAYDSATLKYRLRHYNTDYALPSATTFQNSATFNTNYTQNDVIITDGKAQIIQDIGDNLNGLTTDWLYVEIDGTNQKPDGIDYAKPVLERTSTSIKRKSGNGTNLTDNKANINIVGTIYKENNIIGNNNLVLQVGYKIWQDGTSEPANYTPLTPTISGGNVSVTDYEISNVDFDKIYNYKIILTDKYGYSAVIDDGIVPLGQATWTEYKDRVDFYKITQKGNDVLTVGDILYEGTLLGATSTAIDMTGYSKLRIYAVSYSTQIIFELDLMTQVPQTQTDSQPYTSSGVGSYYAVTQSQFEYHMCEAGVNANKTTFYNIYMGYVRGGTTNVRNNEANYYIYKIEGYK